MISYCENELEVTGASDVVSAFVASCGGEEEFLDFQRLLPEPDIGELGGPKGWYTWRIAHWGTKWSPSDVMRIHPSKTTVVYRYETAGAPAITPIVEASARYPELRFVLSYASDGADFSGQVTLVAGTVHDERAGTCAALDDGRDDGGITAHAPLCSQCARLEPSPAREVVTELRRAVGNGETPEDIADLVISVPDRELVEEHLTRTDREGIWHLARRAVANPLGGAALTALRRSRNQDAATVGRICSLLYASLAVGRADGSVDTGCARLRDRLEEAERRGDLGGFLDTVEGLARGWAGDDPVELLDAAMKLHY